MEREREREGEMKGKKERVGGKGEKEEEAKKDAIRNMVNQSVVLHYHKESEDRKVWSPSGVSLALSQTAHW